MSANDGGRRQGCEEIEAVPWSEIINEVAEGKENFVKSARLPFVIFRGGEVKIALCPPINLSSTHRKALALHILKGEKGLIPDDEKFCWEEPQ